MSTVYHTTNCNWLPLNNFLFQIANVLLVFSYFVPDTLNGLFLLRFFLGTAGLFFGLWGWMILCAPDTFGWNIFFMIGNYIHALYLFIHIKRPRKFSSECELVFMKLFEPLGVKRFQFQKLVEESKLNELHAGDYYAKRGFPAERVSILLTGSIDVTFDGHSVHVTNPLEFLDSPEWASGEANSPAVYDISLLAHEDVTFLSWDHNVLHKLFKKERFLKNVFESIIGKDVTKKLVNITKNITKNGPNVAPFRAGSILYLHHEIFDSGGTMSGEDITKGENHVAEYTLKGTSSRSSTHEIDVNDSMPLFHQHSPQFLPHNNGISLHKAVKLFNSPNNPLIGDDLRGLNMEPNYEGQDEAERETII